MYAGGFNENEFSYVKELKKEGVFVASNYPTMQSSEYVTKDKNLASESACEDINGKKAKALWIQPDPPFLPCHNNPLWEEFLLKRIKEHIDGQADAIHIDEVEGIGGHLYTAGFCKYCIRQN